MLSLWKTRHFVLTRLKTRSRRVDCRTKVKLILEYRAKNEHEQTPNRHRCLKRRRHLFKKNTKRAGGVYLVYLSSSNPGAHLKAFVPGWCDLSFRIAVLPYACFIAMRRPKENLQFSTVTPEHRKRPFYPGTPPFQKNPSITHSSHQTFAERARSNSRKLIPFS